MKIQDNRELTKKEELLVCMFSSSCPSTICRCKVPHNERKVTDPFFGGLINCTSSHPCVLSPLSGNNNGYKVKCVVTKEKDGD